MREFAKVKISLWGSRKFTSLEGDGERLLYLYLHTSPHANSIGCYVLKRGYAAEDLGWSVERFDRAIERLAEADLIAWDGGEQVVRIIDFLKHSPTTNAKHAKGSMTLAMALPDCREKLCVLNDLTADKFAGREDLESAIEDLRKTFDSPIETEPSDRAMHTTETETETKTETGASSSETEFDAAREAPPTDDPGTPDDDDDDPDDCGSETQPEPEPVATTEPEPEQPPEPEPAEPEEPAGPKPTDLIAAFDEVLVEAYGSEHKRGWPAQTDHVTASRWLEAGATVDLVRPVLYSVMKSRAARGQKPPGSLRYFEDPVAEAISRKDDLLEIPKRFDRRQPKADPQGYQPKDPAQYSDHEWTVRVKKWTENGTWTDLWGAAPDQPGCLAPDHVLQACGVIVGQEAASG